MDEEKKEDSLLSEGKTTPVGKGWSFFNRRVMGKFSDIGSWLLFLVGFIAIVTIVVLLATGVIGGEGEETSSSLLQLLRKIV